VAEAGRALGLAQFDVHTWFGLFGPAGLAPDTTQRLNKAVVEALATPELKARLVQLMADSRATTPAEFGAFVAAERAKYEKVVKASGAKAD
jgi:tripartite-type tricarboxylate transporter receptor subunit TctC